MSWLRLFILAFVPLSLAMVRPAAASGGASDWVETDLSAVRLIAANETAGNAEELALGPQIRLTEGWKTYWRSPGDAGYPAQIDWIGSENLAAADIVWPAPKRFSVLGLTMGYDADVVLPVAVLPFQVGEGIHLKARVEYLVCEDICIPHHADLAVRLPSGPARPTQFAHLIARLVSRVPGAKGSAGLSVIAADALGRPAEPVLAVRTQSAVPFGAPDVFVEGPEGLMFGALHVRPEDDGKEGGYRAILSVPIGGTEFLRSPLTASPVTLTLVDGARAVERRLAVGATGTGSDVLSRRGSADRAPLQAPGGLSDPRR
jgi:suppressor for copper-sensitivity B